MSGSRNIFSYYCFMSFRYSRLEIQSKKIRRYFFPVQKSSYTLWEVEDICSIHLVPPKKLEKFFSNCIKTLETLRWDDIWDYLEFGVFNGSSIWSMYHAAKNMKKDAIRFFWFDAFKWLPKESENEDAWVWKQWYYSCSFDKMSTCLQTRNIATNNITRIKGWYTDTLNNNLLKQYNLSNPWIIFIDCDTYSSSKTVLDFISQLIHKPVIICLDDWKLNDLDIKWLWEYRRVMTYCLCSTISDSWESKSWKSMYNFNYWGSFCIWYWYSTDMT